MIIFLHGDDTYRSREKLRELKEKFLREVDPSGANLVTIDGAKASASEIWGAIAVQSFLVRKRMVVIENLGTQKSNVVHSEVTAFLKKIPEDAIVVFWESRSYASAPFRPSPSSSRARREISPKRGKGVVSKNAPKEQRDVFSILLGGKYVEEFIPLEGVALTRWVRDRVKVLGASFEPAAMQELIAAVGSDLWRMHNEMEKLVLAAGALPTPSSSPSRGEGEKKSNFPTSLREGGRGGVGTITSVLVRSLIDTAPSDTPFAFLDALGRGDRVVALRILRELETARVDPQYLLAMLHRQLRLLVMAADCLERGVPASRLAVELGVHPFVAQKLSQQARGALSSKFCALYPRLLELDRKLKSSRAPWEALVELFCLEATAAR